MTSEQPENFVKLWAKALESDPDKMFCRIASEHSDTVLSYRVKAVSKLIARIANAIISILKLKPGERIALLIDAPEDYLVLAHGSWLARVVPVVLSTDLSDDDLVASIQSTDCSTVVFPPASSARVAALFSRLPAVRHWVASGKSNFTSSGAVRRLEDLILQSDYSWPKSDDHSPEDDALIVRTEGTMSKEKFVLFTSGALIRAGRVVASAYPQDLLDGSLVWCGLPLTGFNALVHNCLAPLFAKSAAYIAPHIQNKDFWPFVYDTDIHCAVLSQKELRRIHRRGKPRAWLKPDIFSILLYTQTPLAMTLVSSFEDRYVTPVYTCYSLTEAGGLVSMMPSDSAAEYREEWVCDFDVPSSGAPLPDVEVEITSTVGDVLEEETLGQIRIRSDRAMKSYIGTVNSDTNLRADGILISGDEGYWAADQEGRVHLFVHGRSSEIIERNTGRVSPVKANDMLTEIHGVEFARAIGFPNTATGYEVGAFVVPLRAAQLTEEAVLAILRNELEWNECPKVVIFGRKDEFGNMPSLAEMQEKFAEYFDYDFNFGRSS